MQLLTSEHGARHRPGSRHLHQRLALKRATMWANGTTLHIRFLDGTDTNHDEVRKYAVEWTTVR